MLTSWRLRAKPRWYGETKISKAVSTIYTTRRLPWISFWLLWTGAVFSVTNMFQHIADLYLVGLCPIKAIFYYCLQVEASSIKSRTILRLYYVWETHPPFIAGAHVLHVAPRCGAEHSGLTLSYWLPKSIKGRLDRWWDEQSVRGGSRIELRGLSQARELAIRNVSIKSGPITLSNKFSKISSHWIMCRRSSCLDIKSLVNLPPSNCSSGRKAWSMNRMNANLTSRQSYRALLTPWKSSYTSNTGLSY